MVKAGQKKPIRALAELAEQVVGRSGPVRIVGLRGAAKALASAQLVRAAGDSPVLFLTTTAKQTNAFAEDLRAAALEVEADIYLINPEGIKWLFDQPAKNHPDWKVLCIDESTSSSARTRPASRC